jgi:streptomycin 3"-adenylyltransferase
MNARSDKLIIPPEATRALPFLRDRFGPSLAAVYLHGSAVAGGLRKRSDIDLLAVVGSALSASERTGLSADLMSVSGLYPSDPMGRRPLEVIIFQLADLQPLPYPARTEFVYGEWLRQSLESGAVPHADVSPEYTLLLAQAREEAVALFGPDLSDFVSNIPSSTISRAIGDLLPELVGSIEGDERNVLLTLARMWTTIATRRFVTKDAAADWAMPQLSEQAATTLALARDAYLGRGDDLHLGRTQVSQGVEEMRKRILTILQRPQ